MFVKTLFNSGENGEGGHADWRLISQQGAWGINQARDRGAGPELLMMAAIQIQHFPIFLSFHMFSM